MNKNQSSFHMGNEFNGYDETRYLKGTEPRHHAPVSQEKVQLMPDFGIHLLKMLGGIPTIINPGNSEPMLLAMLGSMPGMTKVVLTKDEYTGTYTYNFNVISNQDLTNGSYPYVKSMSSETPTGFVPFDTAIIYYIDDFKREANWRAEKLKEEFNIDAVMISLTLSDEQDKDGKQIALGFANSWNTLDDSDMVDFVYIFCHGSERMLQFKNGSHYNALTIDGKNSNDEDVAGNLWNLRKKDVVRLHIQACNTGLLDYYKVEHKNVASIMSTKLADDSAAYAWNGSVSFGPPAIAQGAYDLVDADYELEPRVSENQDHYNSVISDLKQRGKIETAMLPMGEVIYHNGKYCPYGYFPGTYIIEKR